MKKLLALTLSVGLFFLSTPVFAQDQTTKQPLTEEQEKQKAELEKNAYRLLDQVIDEAQSLRLTENRVRVQINAGDLIWDQNPGRGRSLFMMAGEGIAELGRAQAAAMAQRSEAMQAAMQDANGFVVSGRVPAPPNPRSFQSFQLRQELVLAAARHDANLAYQLLASTKPPVPTQTAADQRGPRAQITSEDNLEQTLLGRIAALDPKLAAQNAEQMMEKGSFPRTLPEVINQLRSQDAEAADKLADKTVKRLQSANLLTNTEASTLVQVLLALGPRQPVAEGAAQPAPSRRAPALEQSAFIEMLSSVVDAALKVTPSAQGNQRGPGNARRAQVAPGARGQTITRQPPTEAQIEQNSARRLLAGLQSSLHLIDQYLPAKAGLVRQKMTEMGMSTSYNPTFFGVQGNTADALIQAAANAPPQMQSRLYQQAAFKALEEGDTERARQIATDHLQNNARDAVMQRISLREMTKKAEGARLDEVRQAVARLQTDTQKIDLLIQVARDAQKTDLKLATQVLDEARQIANRRATGYRDFEQQLKVAHAFATVDPARSFEILEPGISQLNELLVAAQVLSGFEINMFRDGEMALQGGNGLTAMVNRYGQELAVLARSDFERAETLASRFQFTEPRIMTRLSIVKGILGPETAGVVPGIQMPRAERVVRQD
jgi:hypothetical protein